MSRRARRDRGALLIHDEDAASTMGPPGGADDTAPLAVAGD